MSIEQPEGKKQFEQSYPKDRTGKCFIAQLVRAITDDGVASAIGEDAVALVMLIVGQEDRFRYLRPIDFWDDDLMKRLGWRSEKTISKAKKSAIAAGWLRAYQTTKRKITSYYTTIPITSQNGSDEGSITSESGSDAIPITSESGSDQKAITSQNGGESPSITSTITSTITSESGSPSYLSNLSIPKTPNTEGTKRKRFVPPTQDEVREFCEEKGYEIDNEHFHAHYETNGWKQSNGRPIANWQAAIVTWVKNNERFGRSAAQLKPPTISETRTYFSDQNLDGDPAHFHAHYAANGWKQGSGQPIQNWKAAAVTWSKSQLKFASEKDKKAAEQDEEGRRMRAQTEAFLKKVNEHVGGNS